MNFLAPLKHFKAPVPIAAAGERAAYRFLEFFMAQIRNPNTRRAYGRYVGDFPALQRASLALNAAPFAPAHASKKMLPRTADALAQFAYDADHDP